MRPSTQLAVTSVRVFVVVVVVWMSIGAVVRFTSTRHFPFDLRDHSASAQPDSPRPFVSTRTARHAAHVSILLGASAISSSAARFDIIYIMSNAKSIGLSPVCFVRSVVSLAFSRTDRTRPTERVRCCPVGWSIPAE